MPKKTKDLKVFKGIRLSEVLCDQLAITAAVTKRSQSSIVEEALEEWFEKQEETTDGES